MNIKNVIVIEDESANKNLEFNDFNEFLQYLLTLDLSIDRKFIIKAN